ncbi:MAG: exodeoxyribonuclease VII large subunit [Methanothrix sp.]
MVSVDKIAENDRHLADTDSADVYSVTELSQNLKRFLSETPSFNNVRLKGEISNFVRAASGHIYFDLTEDDYVIACAFFKHQQFVGCSDLGNGIQVLASGTVTVYEKKSQYRLIISKITTIGDGVSSSEFKRRKDKLEREGLFRQDRKKPIPRLPRKIGVITSKDSTAIKDIRTVVDARFPKMDLVLAYATIQGEGAPGSIIQALIALAKISDVDAIILARGGGPSEDFMVLNDEQLVRVIASSTKPIITGIGHERDTCLVDLAADFRASTPSTAAQAVIPDIQVLRNDLSSLRKNLDRSNQSYEEINKVSRYKAIIAVLIVLLLLVILIFMVK